MGRIKKTIIEPEKLDEKPLYKVLIKVNGEELKGEGETIDAAILSIKPITFKTLAYLTLTDGKKTIEMRFNVARMKRMFYNDVFRKIIAEILRRRLTF